jgi:hypothetical protein
VAKPSFSLKQPMNKKDQRFALVGWGMGALFAIGAYVGTTQFLPTEPSAPLMANSNAMIVDPIFTGSIGPSPSTRTQQMALPMGAPLQAQIDELTLEIAALKDMIGATQAATLSTNRRLEMMENTSNITTASVDATDTAASNQPLPASLESVVIAQPEPRIVLPMPVDGGAISVRQRPLMVDGPAGPAEEMPTTLSQTPFAVDLGGSQTLEGIDELWLAHRQAYGSSLDDLAPRILLQQTSEGGLDLRLVAGPINDAADAALLCARLVAAGMERCLPAVFDGQRLALH